MLPLIAFRGGPGVVWLLTMGDERISLVSSPRAHVHSATRRLSVVADLVDRPQRGQSESGCSARDRNLVTCRDGGPMRTSHASSKLQTLDKSFVMPMRM